MKKLFRKLSTSRVIALGFLSVILTGSLLLYLPVSVREGVALRYIDALYTSTSAVCVTGLIAVDAYDTFTPLGQFFLALLIQVGRLGVTSVGAGIILITGKRLLVRGRTLIRDASNLPSYKGVMSFIRSVLITTFTIEGVGAVLSFITFSRDYPLPRALGMSLFHAVAAFNNSGFDIIGGLRNLIPYRSSVLLNITTSLLIISGGIGFTVIHEMITYGFRWHKYSMHARVVISVSCALTVIGTLLLKMSENITWLGAFFFSVSARTAGFSTYPLSSFTHSGLFVLIALIFIGASPGSTGGGIKTTTFFVLIEGIKSAATNRSARAFRYSIPKEAFRKASVITLLALFLVVTSTWILLVLEPSLTLTDALFEMTSAFGTVGLSTGITPFLSVPAKLLSILVMFTGRLGPLTVASLWYFSPGENVRYPEGEIAIG